MDKAQTLILFAVLTLRLTTPCVADGKPIKIGASLALSGKLASVGRSEMGGALLAVENLNAKEGVKGRKIELVVEDNLGEAKSAVATVNKLIRQDEVDILFTAFSHVALAVRDVVKPSGVPMVFGASTSEVAPVSDRFFRDYGDASGSGLTMADFVSGRSISNVSILTLENDACRLAIESFTSKFQKLGGIVKSVESYAPGDTDFKAPLLKLHARSPDVLVLCTWPDTALVMRQMDELRMLDIPTIQFMAPVLKDSNSPESLSLLERNGAISTWYSFVADEANQEQRKFLDRFKERFRDDALLPDAAFAYDDMHAIAEALGPCVTATSVDRACFSEHFARISYEGIAGALRFDGNRHSLRPVIFIHVKDGGWRRFVESSKRK